MGKRLVEWVIVSDLDSESTRPPSHWDVVYWSMVGRPLHEILTVRRNFMDLSQRQLARRISEGAGLVSQGRLCDWENGKRECTMESLQRWVAALGLDLVVSLRPVDADAAPGDDVG